MTEPRHRDQMTSRLTPAPQAVPDLPVRPHGPKFNIVISSSVDGAELLHMTEDDRGRLVVTGPEDRWDEGARLFLHQMMQWAGLVGIRWKDEAKAAVPE